ncbi:MAG TPA: glycosyltransferase [Rhodopila sp.]|nr:glycosyltransferase [Rhodopila sp.]
MGITDYGVRTRAVPTRPVLQPGCSGLSIAIYIHDLSPGGVERQCLVLAREFQQRDAHVVLVVHQMRGELLPLLQPGIPVVNLHAKRTLHDVIRLRRFLAEERPDVLMANVDHNNVAAALAKAISGSSTRLVICQHNPISAGFHATVNWKHRFVPICYRTLEGKVDHAVAVSNGIARELEREAGFPPEKITTIHNAVIGDDFAERAAAPASHPWLVHKDRPVFVTAGRLVEMKDHRTLLRAFALFLESQPGRLIVLGVGPMLDELRELAAALDIENHVAFAGFTANPLPFMRAADAFVLSSRSEGFGNVLVEAMGCGTPVVSTNCPHGPADILSQGEYGMLVPPRDPDALARAMARVLQEQARWTPERLKARAAAFSYTNCAESYLRLFHQLV